MPVSRENNIWGRVRAQLKEAQEMILNGRYAEAMVQNRELLKILVGLQMDRACLVTSSLGDDIAQLFDGRWISKQTRDNYQTIRILGDQAEAGQNRSAQDANTSFYLLKEELEAYVDKNARAVPPERTERQSRVVQEESRETRQRQPQQRRASGQSRQSSQSRARNSSNSNRRRREEPVNANIYDILKIVIPVACVILLVILIRTIWTGGDSTTATTAAPTEAVTEAVTTEVPTEAVTEAETEALRTFVTTKNANLRTAPNTDADTQVIRVIPQGTEVQVKGDYDADWVIVDENGQDAYLSRTVVEEQTQQ